jgi:GTPase Era involved in 16S rRNA processing
MSAKKGNTACLSLSLSILFTHSITGTCALEQDNIFDADYVTDRGEKFVVAEFIREKLMRHLTDELPYDLTVEIEQYELE